ncbi:chalcone isomerase family protein [Leeia oryzae]|uniref:chalcone isomerase family protein n=1 Tax=Leeia oryzae TaxID=356662 RepID=UPI00068758A7|nr:chalcone isomerase family protein [Leeia oryzae]
MSSSSCCKRRNPLWWLLLLCGLSLMPAAANSWRTDLPAATLVGSGELSWLGFRIYTARLWSEQKPFAPDKPFALELTYHRSISRSRFVDTSLAEIRRLSANRYSPEQLKRWEEEMQRAFIDVEAGDQLIGMYLPGIGCRFYSRQQVLAEIRDPTFANAFFAIWLDERTKDSRLRAQLLGQGP